MDLGCLDLGCCSVLDKQRNETVDPEKKDGDAEESVMATAKVGKNRVSKETGQSTLSAVNRSTSQIKKPPHRKNSSPLNWFPRKKMDSYLKRKIRLLQEVGGMNSTLDETLGDSNPHYSRVLREKIAAREAACKAMEARKAAMVEASWCRILRAARIQSKEAEILLLEAEKNVVEAFEAAAAMGVIMYDRPDCPQKPCEIESSLVNRGGSTTHTITASFENAFDVDKEVAAAVKTAFIRLANCPSSSNKYEFRDLLRRISQNPDKSPEKRGETNQEVAELSSECESDTGSELESQSDGLSSQASNFKMFDTEMRQRKCKDRRPDINSTKLVDVMLERLKCLQEDELASLTTIVATCGLNAALLEVENSKQHDPEIGADYTLGPSGAFTRNFSSLGAGTMRHSNMVKQVMTELPSLDKFLVKHISRLEREVQEAKNTRKTKLEEGSEEKPEGSVNGVDNSNKIITLSEAVPDLGSILVKHSSKLEKEIEEAKKKSGKAFEKECKQLGNMQDATEVPSLDKYLVKHVSRLEREVQEAKNTINNDPMERSRTANSGTVVSSQNTRKNKLEEGSEEKPEGSVNGVDNSNKIITLSEAVPDLGSILIKHSSKLEKEIEEAKKKSGKAFEKECKQLGNMQDATEVPSLDKYLVKHVSRLEREVEEAKNTRNNDPMERSRAANSGSIIMVSSQDITKLDDVNSPCVDGKRVGKENVDLNKQADGDFDGTAKEKLETEQTENQNTMAAQHHNSTEHSERSLTIKQMSRIERAKLEALEAFSLQDGNGRKEMDNSLERVLVKPVTRLEREKMQALALGSSYGTQKKQKKQGGTDATDFESLDKVLVKHVSRLEKEKMGLGRKEEVMKVSRNDPQFAKSTDSLDKILVKHQSRLEREKSAAAQQSGDQIKHFETRREARERELQETWGGLSLGNSIRPHLSRLERDKAAWLKAEEEQRKQAREM